MADFAALVAEEMFLPSRLYHKEFRAFARDAIAFLDGLPNKDELTAQQAVDQLIRAQAAGLLPPMPELEDFSGDGTYVVEEKSASETTVKAGVQLKAISVGVDLLRRRESVENITHHVAWKARAILPDRDRLEAIVASAEELRASFAEEDRAALNGGG